MGLLDQYSVETTGSVKEKAAATALSRITIGELYVFLLKLMVAGAMATAPIALVIWFVNYAASH
jgi:hypothetical protein